MPSDLTKVGSGCVRVRVIDLLPTRPPFQRPASSGLAFKALRDRLLPVTWPHPLAPTVTTVVAHCMPGARRAVHVTSPRPDTSLSHPP